jgi:hypothetical protein
MNSENMISQKEQFILAEKLKVPEDWEDDFSLLLRIHPISAKDFDAARREFIMILQSDSSGPPASYKYGMLAETYWKLGEHRQARQYEDLAKKSTAIIRGEPNLLVSNKFYIRNAIRRLTNNMAESSDSENFEAIVQ